MPIETELKGETVENRIVTNPYTPESRRKTGRAHLACGLWLRVGFVGASGVAAGLLQLFAGMLPPPTALALALGGGALAAFSWWRAHAILDNLDRAEAVAADVRSPADAGAVASA